MPLVMWLNRCSNVCSQFGHSNKYFLCEFFNTSSGFSSFKPDQFSEYSTEENDLLKQISQLLHNFLFLALLPFL